jgi:hypothetical protein
MNLRRFFGFVKEQISLNLTMAMRCERTLVD